MIIGGGVIGLEVAAAAATNGRRVVVVEAGDRVMARARLAPCLGLHRRPPPPGGVDLRLNATVTAASDDGDKLTLQLSDGGRLVADLVVVGIGVVPNDALARGCGLATGPDGILVDGHGATGDPGIYAAGEVAAHFNSLLGRHDRQETWAHAAAHGLHVGRSIVAPAEPYGEIGAYWTDQYDFTLNVVGQPVGQVDVVRNGPQDGAFTVFHLAADTLVGVSAINSARELRAARKLILSGHRVDPAMLATAGAALKPAAG